jgi:hypothetical protein
MIDGITVELIIVGAIVICLVGAVKPRLAFFIIGVFMFIRLLTFFVVMLESFH